MILWTAHKLTRTDVSVTVFQCSNYWCSDSFLYIIWYSRIPWPLIITHHMEYWWVFPFLFISSCYVSDIIHSVVASLQELTIFIVVFSVLCNSEIVDTNDNSEDKLCKRFCHFFVRMLWKLDLIVLRLITILINIYCFFNLLYCDFFAYVYNILAANV